MARRLTRSTGLLPFVLVACGAPDTSVTQPAQSPAGSPRAGATTLARDFEAASTLESPGYRATAGTSGSGVVETLHPDGQLASRGRLNAKGEKDGVWETWYPSGMLEWRGRYVDGALEGESRKWYETNAPWFVAEMREGRSQHMDVWHVNGCRAMERVWTAGSDAMDEARWWDTGRAMAVGRFIPSRPSGTQCTNRSGLWLEWTEDGSLHLHESGFYRDGIKVRDLAPEEVAEAEVARARLEAALSSAERYFPARPGDPRDR